MTLISYILIGTFFSILMTALAEWTATHVEDAPEYDTADVVLFIVFWPLFATVFTISMINQFRK